MVPIENLFDPAQFPEHDWKADIQTSIFVELEEGYAPAQINELLQPYILVHNNLREDFKVADFYLQPYNELAFSSDIDLSGWVRGRELNRNAVGFLVTITVFLSILILVTACFNFINIYWLPRSLWTGLIYGSKKRQRNWNKESFRRFYCKYNDSVFQRFYPSYTFCFCYRSSCFVVYNAFMAAGFCV
jgi:hypothetical protein